MKKYIVNILFYFFALQSNSQNNLLVKENGLLKVVNFETNNKIVLDTINHSAIGGFNWNKDSLIVCLQNDGVFNLNKYRVADSIFNKLDNKKEFKIINFRALYFHTPKNLNTTYEYDNIKIIIKNGLKITCIINEVIVWEKSINIFFLKGFGFSGFGYQKPIISNDLSRILVGYINPSLINKNKNILEIDLKTGTVINKIKKSTDYSYSNNSELILYKNKKGILSIFNRNNKKSINYYGWDNAFWLIKNEK